MTLFNIPDFILGSYIFYILEISDACSIACSLFRYTNNYRNRRLLFDATTKMIVITVRVP